MIILQVIMDNSYVRKGLLTIFASCFLLLFSISQPVVKTSVDRNEILIGQQFNVKVQATFSGDDFFIKWIALPDSLQHFELVEKTNIDSTFTNARLSGMSQVFTFTSFDSGKWILPSFNISFNPAKGDTSINLLTDSLPVTVAFSVTDTTSALKDIKAIRQVEVFNTLWYWAGGALLLLILIGIFLWWYFKKRKPVKKSVTSNLSAYEEAMQELKKLQSHSLISYKETQQYHIALVEIFKQYLSRKENTTYQNNTTGDILLAVKQKYSDKDITAKVAAALRLSDAVKFAKYMPPVSDSETNLLEIKSIINLMEPTTKP